MRTGGKAIATVGGEDMRLRVVAAIDTHFHFGGLLSLLLSNKRCTKGAMVKTTIPQAVLREITMWKNPCSIFVGNT